MVKKTYNQQQLKDKIESCKKCRRLTHYRKLVFRDRPIRFQNESYWNKPVYGFGDSNAELLILGSAPAAHGELAAIEEADQRQQAHAQVRGGHP